MEKLKGRLSRRNVFAGAGAVGAAAAAATLLPGLQAPEPMLAVKTPPEKGGGYELTEHVKRYYQTART